MYPLNRHQATLVPRLMRARMARILVCRDPRLESDLLHVLTTGRFEDRIGATPHEKKHGLPTWGLV